MTPDFFDNRSKILKDDLVAHVQAGDKMSVAASVFSMYAYRELLCVRSACYTILMFVRLN